jgi:hypothetical protein
MAALARRIQAFLTSADFIRSMRYLVAAVTGATDRISKISGCRLEFILSLSKDRHDGKKPNDFSWLLIIVCEVLKGIRAVLELNFDGRQHYGYRKV